MDNNIFKICICDDDERMLEDICKSVKELKPQSEVVSFMSGIDLLEHLEKSICDILLLDIDMPDITGMDIAKRLMATQKNDEGKQPLLIFVTSHDELVYESFQYHPFGFIRKNYFKEEIKKVLNDCEKVLLSKTKYFNFRQEGMDIRVLLADIKYFEADSNYLKIYAKDEEYRFRSTMTAVENTLDKQGFIRIHKGFLVNQAAVKSIGSETANLTDDTILPVGKTYVDEAKAKLMRYMR